MKAFIKAAKVELNSAEAIIDYELVAIDVPYCTV